MAGEGAAVVGSAAGNFIQGFMNARLSNAELALRQHAARLEDLKTLAAMNAQAPQEVQAEHAGFWHDQMTQAEKDFGVQKAQKAAQDGGGIGGFFKNLFGRKTAAKTQTPTSAAPTTAAPPNIPALPSVSPDSQTFGGLPSDMAGSTAAKEPSPFFNPSGAPLPSELPAPPTAGGAVPSAVAAPAPTTRDVIAASMPTSPATQPAVPPASPDAVHDWMPSAINLVMGSRLPIVGMDGKPALNHAGQVMHSNPNPTVARQHAQDAAQAAMGQFEQILAKRPDLNTLDAVYADPQIGPAFTHMVSSLTGYENTEVAPQTTLLPKGTLEQWKQRFPDARANYEKAEHDKQVINGIMGKYPSVTGDTEADTANALKSGSISADEGRRVLGNFRRQGAEDAAKQQPSQIQEAAVNKAYMTTLTADPNSPEYKQAKTVVDANQNKLTGVERGKMLPIDQARQAALDEMNKGIKNGPAFKLLQAFMPVAQPPQPVQAAYVQAPPSVNQITGVSKLRVMNTRSGQYEERDSLLPPTFDHSSLQDPNVDVQVPKINRVDGKPIPGRFDTVKADVYNPEKVRAAFESGKMGPQALSMLQDIVNSHSFRTPEDEARLAAYLKAKQTAAAVGPNRY